MTKKRVTDFAASVFSLSAVVGVVWVAISGVQLLRKQRGRVDDPVEQIR